MLIEVLKKAIAESIKYLIRDQPKSNPAIALKQFQKATLKTKPIEAPSLAQPLQAASKISKLFFINSLATTSSYYKTILEQGNLTNLTLSLLYLQYSSKTTTFLPILAFSSYSYNYFNNSKKHSSSKTILCLLLSYNPLA